MAKIHFPSSVLFVSIWNGAVISIEMLFFFHLYAFLFLNFNIYHRILDNRIRFQPLVLLCYLFVSLVALLNFCMLWRELVRLCVLATMKAEPLTHLIGYLYFKTQDEITKNRFIVSFEIINNSNQSHTIFQVKCAPIIQTNIIVPLKAMRGTRFEIRYFVSFTQTIRYLYTLKMACISIHNFYDKIQKKKID